jgi:enoyl-CoA hydratase/carnithine racemase
MDQEILAKGGVLFEQDDAVATVTLNRPERRNAQDPHMWAALDHVHQSLGDDVRIVVLRGSGESFSAGLDRRMLDPTGSPEAGSMLALLDRSDEEIADAIGEYQKGFLWLHDPRFVSIAVVQGHAIGAGFQLALAADIRIAHDDVKLCMKEPFYGLVPDLAGTKRLVELVGYSRALELVATTRTLYADEVRDLGLANLVLPSDEVEASLRELVKALTAPMHGALIGTKQLLLAAGDNHLQAQARFERETQVTRFRELQTLLRS